MRTRDLSVSALLLTCVVACGPIDDGGEPPIEATANQPPVAALSVPSEVRAGEPFTLDASGSIDLDGTVVTFALMLDDIPVEGAGPAFSLVLPDDAPHVVTLVVTDDASASARAKARVTALPPADGAPPVLSSVDIAVVEDGVAGPPLGAEAAVLGGSTLALSVSASDSESDIVELTVTASGGALTVTHLEDVGPQRTAIAELLAPDIDTSITIEVTAVDAYAHATTTTRTLTVWSTTTDSDDDGVPDAVDPAPATPNGVLVEVYALAEFPRDWLGNQLAEDVVTLVEDASPLHTFTVPSALLAAASPDGTTTALALDAGMPLLETNFALFVRGRIVAPPGMPTARVSIGADDVGVFFVEGAPVASADDEFALNFFRTERLPSEVGPLFFGGAPVSYGILVANESGPFAFDVSIVFEGPGGASIDTDDLSLASFLLPE